MPIDLYYVNLSSPCRSVLVTAKHLGIEVNIKTLDLSKGEHKTEEFLKINPAHTVPTLVDGDLALWESRAIMQYLCNRYAPNSSLYPSDPKKRAIVDKMLNFDMTYNSSIYPVIAGAFRGSVPTEQQITNYKNNLKLLDTLIGSNKYVGGDELTIADFSIANSTTLLSLNDFADLNDCPNLKAWFGRINAESTQFKELTDKAAEEAKSYIAAQKAQQK